RKLSAWPLPSLPSGFAGDRGGLLVAGQRRERGDRREEPVDMAVNPVPIEPGALEAVLPVREARWVTPVSVLSVARSVLVGRGARPPSGAVSVGSVEGCLRCANRKISFRTSLVRFTWL